jgi:hypothetical protein
MDWPLGAACCRLITNGALRERVSVQPSGRLLRPLGTADPREAPRRLHRLGVSHFEDRRGIVYRPSAEGTRARGRRSRIVDARTRDDHGNPINGTDVGGARRFVGNRRSPVYRAGRLCTIVDDEADKRRDAVAVGTPTSHDGTAPSTGVTRSIGSL